jgi:hypothetical protein
VVSERLLNRQFIKLYEHLRNCWGKFFSYFRMSMESSDKLLVVVGQQITCENIRLLLSVPPQERLAVREYFAKYFTSPEGSVPWQYGKM